MTLTLALHHVSAVASDAQANVDFYAGTLGLRLVKQTINYDDPTSLHLYYGDETGSPGSLLTFFIVKDVPQGRVGWPQVTGLELGGGAGGPAWRKRLGDSGYVEHDPDAAALAEGRLAMPSKSFAEWRDSISVPDPDGMPILLAAGKNKAFAPPTGLRDVVLSVGGDWRPTADFLQQTFDLTAPTPTADGAAARFPLDGGAELVVEQLDKDNPGWGRGQPGAGTVHHVAFRVADEAGQATLHDRLRSAGVNVSPTMDRTYFQSIYFREPGGVLLEVATDGPGMGVDEPAGRLGETLCLPPELEPERAAIEANLPKLSLPSRG